MGSGGLWGGEGGSNWEGGRWARRGGERGGGGAEGGGQRPYITTAPRPFEEPALTRLRARELALADDLAVDASKVRAQVG